MDRMVLAAPILPEKTEAWHRFCQEIRGSRRRQYETSRRELCIVRETAWLAPTPHGAMVIIAMTVPDLAETWQKLGKSQRPFDRWFRRRVLEIHGLDLSQSPTFHVGEPAFQWQSSQTEE